MDLSNKHQAAGRVDSLAFPGLGVGDDLSIDAPLPMMVEDQLNQLSHPGLVVPDEHDPFFNPDELLDDNRPDGGN